MLQTLQGDLQALKTEVARELRRTVAELIVVAAIATGFATRSWILGLSLVVIAIIYDWPRRTGERDSEAYALPNDIRESRWKLRDLLNDLKSYDSGLSQKKRQLEERLINELGTDFQDRDIVHLYDTHSIFPLFDNAGIPTEVEDDKQFFGEETIRFTKFLQRLSPPELQFIRDLQDIRELKDRVLYPFVVEAQSADDSDAERVRELYEKYRGQGPKGSVS